jgi:hypothetical protein
MTASHGLLARIQRADAGTARRFGPRTAEVEAFIAAAAELTPSQWDQVFAVRRLVASVTKEGPGEPAETARSIQAAIKGGESRISEPMARAGEALFAKLAKKSQQKQVAAWQAMSGLVLRSSLPPLKFAVLYAPFGGSIPVWGFEVLDPKSAGLVAALHELAQVECEILARRWRADPAASRALLQATARHRHAQGEEAAAIAALTVVPAHLQGDQGWAAIRTAVHGGRVLSSLSRLSEADLVELWAPLEPAIPFTSLEEKGRALPPGGGSGQGGIKLVAPAESAGRQAPAARPKLAGLYGPGTAEVAAFIKGLGQLTPIQWLRVLDRRKLVASVTREGTSEPSRVVRSILAAVEGTRELDLSTRCRAFAAVERAGHAVQGRGRIGGEQAREMYRPFEAVIPMEGVAGGGFARKLAALGGAEWEQAAAASPAANDEAVAPLVNAADAMLDFAHGRSDDEVVAAWHACSALVERHHLTPIKFAASYAPFASAIPVIRPKALGAVAARYVTALGRLGAAQCAALARPWQIDDELSSVLSKVTVDGSARSAEEAAALAAVVVVPMRLAGGGGWAAVKTAAFGGRVIASRGRLTVTQLEALWAPLQPAIPLASLEAPPKSRH